MAVPAQISTRLQAGRTVTVMVTILSAIVSIFEFRIRSRASLEFELVALRHQVTVLRRQRPGRTRLSSLDRLLWVMPQKYLDMIGETGGKDWGINEAGMKQMDEPSFFSRPARHYPRLWIQHPSSECRGTSTPMIHALPSAHYRWV
jgi:hypothetical protein